MYKTIEKKLLNILKQYNKNDRLIVINQILEGTYSFADEVLANLSLKEIRIHFTKLIIHGLKHNISLNEEELNNALEEFSDNVDNISEQDLLKVSRNSVKLDLLLINEKMKSSMKNAKKNAIIVGVALISTTMTLGSTNSVHAKPAEISSVSIVDNEGSNEPEHNPNDDLTVYLNDGESINFAEPEHDPNDNVNEEIRIIICEKYNLTRYQFDVVSGVVHAEALYDSYDDGYAVINTIYNRAHSIPYVTEINREFKDVPNAGMNLYYQVISKDQFTVYTTGAYKEYIGKYDGNVYDAIVDFLLSEKKKHNCASFRSPKYNISGSIQFVERGNQYFGEIPADEWINTEDNELGNSRQ